MNRKVLLKTLLKVAVSAGILFVLVTKLKTETLLESLQALSLWKIGLALLLYFFCQFISSYRWLILARSMQLGGGIFQFYHYYLMGMFFGLFLPTAIGGDVGRAMLLAKEKSSTWLRSFLSIFAERLCGLNGLLIYLIVGLIIVQPTNWDFFLLLTAPLEVAVLGFSLYFRWIERHPWGERLIQRFIVKQNPTSEDPGDIWPHRKAIWLGIFYSLLFHGCSMLLLLYLLRQLGANVPLLLVAIVYGVAGLASMLPISLSGIGVREGTMTVLLMEMGHVPQDKATAFSLVWLSLLLLATIPGGLLSLRHQLSIPSHKKV